MTAVARTPPDVRLRIGKYWQSLLRDRAASRSEPTYLAYEDADRPPRVRLFLAAFDAAGTQLDTEEVDLDGYSAREVVAKLGANDRKRWLADRFIQAHARLYARIGPPS
jgi:hypothetical protein